MTAGDSSFRGWVRPGPVPPGASRTPDVPPGETLDHVSGHFRLYQLRAGHRFSTDDVLTAWYGTTWCPSPGRVLDLGSGIGTVATIAAWRVPGAAVVTVEAQEVSVALARKSAAYNGLEGRMDIRLGDFRDPAVVGDGESFDLILGSPPYFPVGAGVEGDHPQKVACRFELRGDVRDYCAVAARHLAPGGFFATVFPLSDGQQARATTAGRTAGLSLVRMRPVVFREGAPPLIGLFGFMRAGDLPEPFRAATWTEAALTIRTASGDVHPEYSALKLAIGFPP